MVLSENFMNFILYLLYKYSENSMTAAENFSFYSSFFPQNYRIFIYKMHFSRKTVSRNSRGTSSFMTCEKKWRHILGYSKFQYYGTMFH